MKNELKEKYTSQVVPALKEQFGLTNPNQVANLEKIVLTTHIGKYINDRKVAVEDAVLDLGKITGQKPSVVYARKSVANFKVREGEVVGARVTLRGEGIADQSIFPEIEIDQIKRQLGFDLIIVTTCNCDKQAKALLDGLGYPFRKPAEKSEAAA